MKCEIGKFFCYFVSGDDNFYSARVTKVAPVEHLDSGKLLESTRQCPELRQHLVMASRHLMLKMRAATNKIIKQYPWISRDSFWFCSQCRIEKRLLCYIGRASSSQQSGMQLPSYPD